jgi:hypothetical protein
MVEHRPSIHEALGSIPSTGEKKGDKAVKDSNKGIFTDLKRLREMVTRETRQSDTT